MNISIPQPQRLLLALIISGISFVAVVASSASPFQPSTARQARVQQQGYGHAPHPPLTKPQVPVQQQGYGHAPHPPLTKPQVPVQQQGYGHAPPTPVESIFFLRE